MVESLVAKKSRRIGTTALTGEVPADVVDEIALDSYVVSLNVYGDLSIGGCGAVIADMMKVVADDLNVVAARIDVHAAGTAGEITQPVDFKPFDANIAYAVDELESIRCG
jgi:hypothetical protein